MITMRVILDDGTVVQLAGVGRTVDLCQDAASRLFVTGVRDEGAKVPTLYPPSRIRKIEFVGMEERNQSQIQTVRRPAKH